MVDFQESDCIFTASRIPFIEFSWFYFWATSKNKAFQSNTSVFFKISDLELFLAQSFAAIFWNLKRPNALGGGQWTLFLQQKHSMKVALGLWVVGGVCVPVYLSLTLVKGLTYRPDTDLIHTGDTEALTNGPCDCG